MKIEPVTLAKRGVNLAARVPPLVRTFLKFLAARPKWLAQAYKSVRGIGLYQFTDRKGRRFNILLLDGIMDGALRVYDTPSCISRPNSHGPRQFVLNELREAVAVDKFCPDFEVPHAEFQWSHPSLGFKKIERLRDATSAERKAYTGSPLR